MSEKHHTLEETKETHQQPYIPNDTELLRAVLSNIPGYVYQFYVKDAGPWGFYYLNTRTDKLLGKNWDEPDFVEYAISVLSKENKEHIIQSIREAARDLTPWSYEFKYAHLSGGNRHIRASSNPQRRENEVVFTGVVMDITEHIKATEALSASEQRLRAIVANTQEIIHILDWQGAFRYLSPSWERVTGFPIAETLGKSFTEFTHPEDLRACIELLKKVHATGEPHKLLEFRVRHASGDWIWFTNSGVAIKDEQGIPQQFMGIGMDITERKRAEEALAEREERLRAIIDNTDEIIYTLDWEGNFKFLSPAWEHITGQPIHHSEGASFKPFVHPEDVPACARFLHKVYMSGQPQRGVEFRVKSKARGWVWFTSTGAPIKDEQGRLLYYAGVAMDISERKHAEEALAASEQRLRTIIDNAEEIIFTLDWEGKFQFLSPAWTSITGRSIAEALGKSFIPFVHPDDREPSFAFFNKVRETGQPQRGLEFRTQSTSGKWLYFSVSGAAIKDEKGAPLYYVGVGMDITERKEAEEERLALERSMQQVQKLESLGVLAGGIAHDFNNLLMAILGHAELAKINMGVDNGIHTNLSRIEMAAGRAADLCQQMLAYAGKGRFIIEHIQLDSLIREMFHLLEASISKKIVLSLQIHGEAPLISGDATQIRQVILNLITNASEAIGIGEGAISIATDVMHNLPDHPCFMDIPHAGGWVILEIRDNGCGMDRQTRERMYEPFFTTKFTGRGLGMAAVQGIMRSHKGHIEVETAPGCGTCFRLYFPALKEQLPAEEKPCGKTSSGHAHHGRVLLVDDEEELRIVGTEMLRAMGYDVITAADGRQALDIFTAQQATLDIILLDLTMPVMDGKETLQELRRINAHVPVIIASGYAEPDIAERFAGMDMAGFIQKPYSFENLAGILIKALSAE